MDPGRPLLIVILGCGLVAGCASPAPTDAPDARPRADARPGEETVVMGACLADADLPCAGVPGEVARFVPLADDDVVTMTVGPQGATMVVLSARTSEMYAGDPGDPGSPDNPDVSLRLYRAGGDHEIGHYRGRPGFVVETDGTTLTAHGLFVVLETPANQLDGVSIDAAVSVEDRDGVVRWGDVRLVATR